MTLGMVQRADLEEILGTLETAKLEPIHATCLKRQIRGHDCTFNSV